MSSAITSASDAASPGATGPARRDSGGTGRAVIRVARGGSGSAVTRAFATSPLRLLTPRNHGQAAWIYTSSYGGGLVGGDRLAIDVDVAAGASAWLSTQASTKVYRSPIGSSAELTARVANGGLLVVAPDPVVCFRASRYRQSQRFDLEAGAGLVVVDWVTSGRRASGERWEFDEYCAYLRVELGGTLVVVDSLRLRQDEGELAARMGRFDVLAVVLVVGAELIGHAKRVVSMVSEGPPVKRPDRLVAAATLSPASLGDVGCLVRVAARSVEDAARTIRRCLAFVPELLGDDPWARKW
jgi:urease accessory protein